MVAFSGWSHLPCSIHIYRDAPAKRSFEPRTSTSRTHITDKLGSLCLYVNPDILLSEGEVLWVELPTGSAAFYQIVSAQIAETDVDTANRSQRIRVVASQLGIWQPERCRSEPITWVAPPGHIVHRVAHRGLEVPATPLGHVQCGNVPNSPFPVHVNLEDTVTHNTAIVGVTGSGKSYLVFHLIEALAARGLKVLVLDLSRQHYIFLRSLEPAAIRNAREVAAWIQSDRSIGIHQFAEHQSYPQMTAEFVAAVFEYFTGAVQLRAGRNEPARLCIVFEEAHALIPEWNQVADPRDKDHVNRTARIILQGRKYGLGCIVVSQRTANVTKTILNQCNTIFALQSFDQTGLDFLRNYMGDSYARAISSLPVRHAILVGKASSSTRPVLFGIQDFAERWADDDPGDQVQVNGG